MCHPQTVEREERLESQIERDRDRDLNNGADIKRLGRELIRVHDDASG